VRFPIRLEGDLSPKLSRWLWLVKWFLAIPHFVILFFLWFAFGLLTIVAFFALLFTGRYPRGMFDFNTGVLRWSWRVLYYSYSALATDEYPPFTLKDVPTYPARLELDYPETHRRGLPLIGWWIIGAPQYAIAGILSGTAVGGSAAAGGGDSWPYVSTGLIDVLVFVVAMLLLFKNRYPRDVFDVLLGFNRWCFRALAYGTFLTPVYPPFRLDPGPREP
jgi:Domain of unknown function (DUF4389)